MITVVVVRPGARGIHGDTGPATEHTIALSKPPAPRTTGETEDRGPRIVTGMDLYTADPNVDIRSTDRVRVDGVVWDVDGDPERWPPRGAVVHLGKQDG